MSLPRVRKVRVRSMHVRGIKRCIEVNKMTTVDEIAAAVNLSVEQVNTTLTSVQKMQLGKLRKKAEKDAKPIEDETAAD